jgi:acyl-CoA thioesterase
VGDFVAETELERVDDQRFRAVLSPSWTTWGPAGGYVSALALRAAGAATPFVRPISYACQFLAMARLETVELAVESLRRGKRSEALRVSMSQAGRAILVAQVWVMDANEGMVHDFVPTPELPDPETLPNLEALRPDHQPHAFFRNFEERPIGWVHPDDPTPGEPERRGFYRFRPRARAEDAFADAARALILIDVFTWAATWRAHPSKGPLPWIAPNLDLYVRFHRDTRPHEWLYCGMRADLAEDGLIAAQGSVWSPGGKLLVSGASQLFCAPRPERFR